MQRSYLSTSGHVRWQQCEVLGVNIQGQLDVLAAAACSEYPVGCVDCHETATRALSLLDVAPSGSALSLMIFLLTRTQCQSAGLAGQQDELNA